MSIHYIEDKSMKGLAQKLSEFEKNIDTWNTMDVERNIAFMEIQKDGDMFCAIVSDSVLLVRGKVQIFTNYDNPIDTHAVLLERSNGEDYFINDKNPLSVKIDGGKLDKVETLGNIDSTVSTYR